MSARVEAAEHKVDKCKGLLEMHTSAFERAKKQFDTARADRNQATDTLKDARASLAVIKKAKKTATKDPKHITASKAKKASASNKKAEAASNLAKEVENIAKSVCTICHKAAVKTPISVLGCGCKFHHGCMVKWVGDGHKTCPTCLAPSSFSGI